MGRGRDRPVPIDRPYSKRYFQLFVLKKLNIHHEGHEEHEEKQRKLWNISYLFQIPS